MAWLKEKRRTGEVLLITHAAFLLLPYFHRREDWRIDIDEVPGCDTFSTPGSHGRGGCWTSCWTSVPTSRTAWACWCRRTAAACDKWLEQPRDDGDEAMRTILAEVANPNKEMHVDLDALGAHDRAQEGIAGRRLQEPHLLPRACWRPRPSLA